MKTMRQNLRRPNLSSSDFSDSEGLAMEHGTTWRLNTEESDWWVSAAEGRDTGDVDEADGNARETKENMAKINTKAGT